MKFCGTASDAMHFRRLVTEAIAAQDADLAQPRIAARLIDVVYPDRIQF